MAAPFRFLDRIDVLVDGPASVLTTVRQLVLPGGDRPVTKASDASRIPADDVRRHVVGVALDVVTERVRDGLVEALREHLDEVRAESRAEFEMLEGDVDEDNKFTWWTKLEAAVPLTFAGSGLEQHLRGSELEAALGESQAIQRLADAVLAAPVADPDAVLARVGVGSADVDALVAEVRRPARTAVMTEREMEAGELVNIGLVLPENWIKSVDIDGGWSIKCLAAYLSGRLGIDAPLVEEGVTYVLTDPDMVATGAELLGLADDAAFLAWAEERLMTSTPQEDAAAVAEVLRLAGANAENSGVTEGVVLSDTLVTATGGDEGVPPAALAMLEDHIHDEIPIFSRVVKPAAPPPSEESELTRAVGAALAALYDHGCETDKAMAEALGVPKTTINQARHMKTPWAPTAAQKMDIEEMLMRHAEPLDQALKELLELDA